MWIFKCVTTEESFYLLNVKTQYTVGRIGADLVLKDTSVSRTHAILHVVAQPTGTIAVDLEDVGSKFGTYRNQGLDTKTKLPDKGKRVRLCTGDRIRFGLLTSVYTVHQAPIISLASGLSDSELQEFQRCHRALAIRVLDEWVEGNDCATHFTISEEKRFTPTKKVLHALLSGLTLVTCDYWRELLSACETGGTAAMPEPAQYRPQAWLRNSDCEIRDCERIERQRLFVGLVFVFVNRKSYDVYRPIVEKAGGECRFALTADFQALPQTFVLDVNVITIEYIPETQTESSQTVTDLLDYVKKHSRRLIPEYEIGLAILACSTAKHCNPAYTIVDDLLPTEPLPIVPDTENAGANDTLFTMFPTTIPESSVGEEAARSPLVGRHMGKRKKCQRLLDSSDDDDDVEEKVLPQRHTAKRRAPEQQRRLSFVEDSDLELSGDISERSAAAEPAQQRTAKRKPVIDDDSDDDSDDLPLAKRPHTQKQQPLAESQNPIEDDDPKAAILDVFGDDDDDDDDDDLFLSVQELKEKKRNVSAGKTAQPKALPLLIETAACRKAKGKLTKDTTGFLEKSQRQQCSGQLEQAPPNKRPLRIPVLGEDDDDSGDDLFAAGNGSPKRTTTQADQFDFRERSGKPLEPRHVDCAVVETSAKSPPEPQTVCMPKPKPLPKTLNVSGWLSCGLQAIKIEKFDVDGGEGEPASAMRVKTEANADDDWVNNLKCAVSVKPLNVSWRPKTSVSLAAREQAAEVDTSVPGKNFKRFVKKAALCPAVAKKLVKTVSETVGGNSFM